MVFYLPCKPIRSGKTIGKRCLVLKALLLTTIFVCLIYEFSVLAWVTLTGFSTAWRAATQVQEAATHVQEAGTHVQGNLISALNRQPSDYFTLLSSQQAIRTTSLPDRPLRRKNSLTDKSVEAQDQMSDIDLFGKSQKRNRAETLEQIVNKIIEMSGESSSDVINLLQRTLTRSESNATCILEHLKEFERNKLCHTCRSRRTPPVTYVGTKARIEYHRSWRGFRLPLISVTALGRLGNIMGEYASILALKEVFNVSVVITSEMTQKMQKHFPQISLPSVDTETVSDWMQLTPQVFATPSQVSLQLAALGLLGARRFVAIEYPFEVQLFNGYRDKILQELQFSHLLIKKAEQFLTEVAQTVSKQGPLVFVGVHVRLTDYPHYLNWMFGVKYLNYTDYLTRATLHYTSLYDNVVFVVASDDVKETLKIISNLKDENIFLPAVGSSFNNPSKLMTSNETSDSMVLLPRQSEEDMSLLAQCNHSIITVGSYGFWTGYLSSGTTLYPDINTTIPYQHTRPFYEEAGLTDFIPIPV